MTESVPYNMEIKMVMFSPTNLFGYLSLFPIMASRSMVLAEDCKSFVQREVVVFLTF